jgi:hypothetical protein
MITKGEAMRLTSGTLIYHLRYKNADGSTMRARVTGKPIEWKTRPSEFKVPICHGLRDTGYLTHQNADLWSLRSPK